MPFRAWILALWLAGCSLAAGAPPPPGEPAAFRRFTQREGLPQSQVCALLEDRNGFLWVGTYGGVARMGALGFQTFGGIPGLKGSRAWALLEAPDAAVWVAFQDGGLVRIEGNHFRIFGPQEGLTEVDSYALAWDTKENRLLVGTREGLYAGGADRFQKVDLPGGWNTNPIFALHVDAHGGIWMGSRDGQLARWQEGQLREEPLPAEFRAWSIEGLRGDAQGNLYAMGTRGLAVRRNGAWERVPLTGAKGQVRLRGLQLSTGGELLVSLGTDGILSRFPDGRQRILGPSDGLPPEGIFSVLRDRGGRLWVGTNGGGLVVQGVPGLVNVRTALGHELGDILAFIESPPGVVFVGGGQGMFRWEEGRGFTGHWGPKEGLPGPEVWAFLPDGKGGLWVGTDKGLAHWADGRFTPAPPPLDTAVIQHFQAEGDHLWAGTDTGGLMRLDLQGHLLATHPLPPEASRPNIFSLKVTSQGLLVGSSQGVFKFQDGRFTKMWADAPFSRQRITVIDEDRSRRMWVATTKGLYAQEAVGWSALGLATGLPDELIYFLGDVGSNRVAVGHGRGVSLLGPGRMLNLNLNLGMISDETNQGGFFEDSRGRLWIGQIGGLSRLEGNLLPREDPVPRPVLLEGTWPSGFQALPTRLELPARSRSLSLRVDSGTPLVAFPPQTQVQMQGLDPDWRDAEGGHVQYGQVPPGRYTLQIRSSSDGLAWTYAEPVEVMVAAAWHEHLLGRLLIGLGSLGLVGAGVALRIRALHRSQAMLEERIRERTAALAASEQAAHAASRAKSVFLANMSHELRTPLNAILGFTQLMAREPGQNRQNREHLDRIMRAGEHLLGLINDVLSISKIEAGRLALSLGAFDLMGLLKAVAEMAEVRAQAKGLAFHLEVAGSIPAAVEGDGGKLRQVLLNLVGNALKFTERGSVVLRVAHAQGRAVFEVIDTGPGIPPGEQAELFQAFHQAGAGRQNLEGTGLGLHIGQAMVRLMGGEISLQSHVGQGSRFAFEIPLPASGAAASRGTRRKVLGLAEGQAPLRILAVDDREENRVLLGRLFRLLGCEVMEAEDGVDALGVWEREAPDLVWLDIRMPRMDGFETIERIRALEAERGLPRTVVVALTASAFDHDLAAMTRAGFDGHVVKPFREEELFEAMERLKGVRFRREAEEEDGGSTALGPALDRRALAAQPDAWKAAFRRAIQLGDSAEAGALAEQVADPGLARHLKSLIQAYRFEEIAEGLEEGP